MKAKLGFLVLALMASPAGADPQNVTNRIWKTAGQKPPAPQVIVSPNIPNATIIEGNIVINPMIAAKQDDAVAFFIGHEIVHLIRNHGPSFSAKIRAEQELEADYSGFALAVAAGYNRHVMLSVIAGMGAKDASVYCPWTVRSILLSK